METMTTSFEECVMELIVNGGAAKSGYIEIIGLAKNGKYDEIQSLLDASNKAFEEAHKTHFKMINSEMRIETPMEKMMLIHAEDQMNSAEIFKVVSEELVSLYQYIDTLK